MTQAQLQVLDEIAACNRTNYIIMSGTDLSIHGSWKSLSSPIITNNFGGGYLKATTNWP